MPIMFNTLLLEAGFKLEDVRLLRHKDQRSKKGRSPYELWRDNRPEFERYQSVQGIHNRKKLSGNYWAIFVVNFENEALFGGFYSVKRIGLLKEDYTMPHNGTVDAAGSADQYELKLMPQFEDLVGKMIIEWGAGALAWIQYPERNNKQIIELRTEFKEPSFPGFLNLIEPLSKMEKIPPSWIAALKSSRGIYLLTCPRTKEQYVGSATGEESFWGRWIEYAHTGHGGDVALKSRDTSDYQVSILEVAGSWATKDEILAMEGKWQTKLQSREMGLNRNLAKKVKLSY